MNTAFGITEEDIQQAAAQAGVGLSDKASCALLGQIDQDLVAAAALHYDDLDEQTQAAHDEIRRQLVDLGALEPASRPPALR